MDKVGTGTDMLRDKKAENLKFCREHLISKNGYLVWDMTVAEIAKVLGVAPFTVKCYGREIRKEVRSA